MIRCPACGAQTSLDAVIDDIAASRALQQALTFSPEGPLLVRYLGLFRPVKSRLTWVRVNALLTELLRVASTERIERNRMIYAVPRAVFAEALETVLTARETGQLQTPLKSHGYLYEVAISLSRRAERDSGSAETGPLPGNANGETARRAPDGGTAPRSALPPARSATAQAIGVLEARKRGGQP